MAVLTTEAARILLFERHRRQILEDRVMRVTRDGCSILGQTERRPEMIDCQSECLRVDVWWTSDARMTCARLSFHT